jgi:hypothetical protein
VAMTEFPATSPGKSRGPYAPGRLGVPGPVCPVDSDRASDSRSLMARSAGPEPVGFRLSGWRSESRWPGRDRQDAVRCSRRATPEAATLEAGAADRPRPPRRK